MEETEMILKPRKNDKGSSMTSTKLKTESKARETSKRKSSETSEQFLLQKKIAKTSFKEENTLLSKANEKKDRSSAKAHINVDVSPGSSKGVQSLENKKAKRKLTESDANKVAVKSSGSIKCEKKIKTSINDNQKLSSATAKISMKERNDDDIRKPASFNKLKGKTKDESSQIEEISSTKNKNKDKSESKGKTKVKTPTGKKSCPKQMTQSNKADLPESSSDMTVNVDDPMALLMMMEGQQNKNMSNDNDNPKTSLCAFKGRKKTLKKKDSDADEVESDSELSDWEDVKDHTLPVENERSQVPTESVEITLDHPYILKNKRKKKGFDWAEHLKKQVRKFKREVAINIHKSHILCLISLALRQNSILNEDVVRGLAISLVTSKLTESKSVCRSTEILVDAAMSWYRTVFPLSQIMHFSSNKLIQVDTISNALTKNSIKDARLWVYVFLIILRTLGLSVRLVLSLQPIPFKVTENEASSSKNSMTKSSSSESQKKCEKVKHQTSPYFSKAASKPSSSPSNKSSSTPSSSLSTTLSASKKSSSTYPSSSLSTTSSSSSVKKTSIASSSSRRAPSNRRSSQDSRMKSRKSLKKEESDEDLEEECNDEEDGSDEEVTVRKKKKKSNVSNKKAKEISKPSCSATETFENSESEFEVTSPYSLKINSNRKIVSEDDEETGASRGQDFWLEVFSNAKNKWMCYDCFKNMFGKPYVLGDRATQPLSYVIAVRNDNGVKDVTPRYAKQWLSHTRKMRVNADWLEETFSYFSKATYNERVIEDDDMKSQLMVRPMPSSISDFKNHPLYALQRHLLKFEAIYPETSIPLGYVRKEPIYARECVRTLHSRDNWLKEGRLVRLKEEPYKMVKSRPKWNKPKENPDELDLELYGEWQTEKYIPRPAYNGKVPKNEYGNVELFKPWMLPSGTVHLKIQGAQRVAKKLNIDVAPAMVGWDHHSGRAHPLFDGVIVCQEHADALLVAWDEDQEIQQQREDEKREKRVYGNWRLLIRGLLIKERLTTKFLKDDPLPKSDKKPETKANAKGGKSSKKQVEGSAQSSEIPTPSHSASGATASQSENQESSKEQHKMCSSLANGMKSLLKRNSVDAKLPFQPKFEVKNNYASEESDSDDFEDVPSADDGEEKMKVITLVNEAKLCKAKLDSEMKGVQNEVLASSGCVAGEKCHGGIKDILDTDGGDEKEVKKGTRGRGRPRKEREVESKSQTRDEMCGNTAKSEGRDRDASKPIRRRGSKRIQQ